MKELNVVGLGYIGLPTALMFASHGVDVVGTDLDASRIDMLQNGKLPFDENGLSDLYQSAVHQNMEFSTDCQIAHIYIVAVPTPYDNKSKKIDAAYVVDAVKSILGICPEKAIIVIESTIAPGTVDRFIRPLLGNNEKSVRLAHAPERILPGQMIYELSHNSRTIGADDEETGEDVEWLYAHICTGEIVLTDIRTAEMTKVVENTYRDINIAFANELAKICQSDGMDVYEIIRIANKHPRVSILSPGPGVGGHCIAVDPWFLVGQYPNESELIKQARLINDSMPEYVLQRMSLIMEKEKITDIRRVGLYGLTYKENINDTRISPTLQLLPLCRERFGIEMKVYDPYVTKDIIDNQCHDFDDFLKNIDMVVIMVAHDEIKNSIYKLSGKVIFDTRNICNLSGTYSL